MQKQHLSKALFILLLVIFSAPLIAQKAYSVAEIPDPKKTDGGWVSNPDSILSAGDVASINDTISSFERKTNVQVAVVIVNDFDPDQEDFDFAYTLFNTWGIGQKNSNNGILLFIAKNRRKYRFITGTGAEGLLPDVKLKHIAEQNLIPAFRKDEYGAGIINTLNAMGTIILNPENKSELNQFFTQRGANSNLDKVWLPAIAACLVFFGLFKLIGRYPAKQLKPGKGNKISHTSATSLGCAVLIFTTVFAGIISIIAGGFGWFKNIPLSSLPYFLTAVLSISLFFRYLFLIEHIRSSYYDDENFSNAVSAFHKKYGWMMLFSPLIIFAIIRQLFRRAEGNKRFKPVLDSRQQPMVRLNRDENIDGTPFLTKGQQKEEMMKAYDYDIWLSADQKEHIIKAWPAEKHNQFSACPSCGFRTYESDKQVTVKAATYSHDGQAKLVNECSFCKHVEFIRWVTLAMLVKESSGSSSGSSSSGSSSSSSSWGGGSSSGGGSGGSW